MMKAVARSTSIAIFSTTANSTVVTRLPIQICSVMLPLVFYRTVAVDKSDCCTSSDILDSPSADRISYEIIIGWTAVSGWLDIWSMTLFTMTMKCAGNMLASM